MSSDNGIPTSKWFTIKLHSVGPYYIVHYMVEPNITTDFSAWIVENLKTTPTCKFWRQYAEALIGAIKRNSQVVSFTVCKLLHSFLTRADKHMKKLYASYQMLDAPDLQVVPTSKWFTIEQQCDLYIVTPNITSEFGEWIVDNVDMKTWFVPSFQTYYQDLLNAIKRNTYLCTFAWSEQLREFLAAADKCLDELYARYEMRDTSEAPSEAPPSDAPVQSGTDSQVPTSKWYTCKYKHALYGAKPKLSRGFGEWLAVHLKDELNISTPRVTCSFSQQTVCKRKLFFNVEDLREFLAESEPRMEKLYTRYRKDRAGRGRVSGYTLFRSENRKQVVDDNPGIKVGRVDKYLDKMWHELLIKEKREWNDKASALNKEANECPPVVEQELPDSKWFTVEHGKYTQNRLRVTPKVSPEFGQWLVTNLKEELDIRIGCRTIHSKNIVKAIQHGTTCWCSFTEPQDIDFITAADRRMDELHGRYCAASVTSKWFTIEYKNFWYIANPVISSTFGEWISASKNKISIWISAIKDKITISDTINIGNCQYSIREQCLFSSMENLREFLAKTDPYMDKLCARYVQEQAALPLVQEQQAVPRSKWFTIEHSKDTGNHQYRATPKLSGEFCEWLVTKLEEDLPTMTIVELPAKRAAELGLKSPADLYCTVTADKFAKSIKENSQLLYFTSLEIFTEMLGKLDQYLDDMYSLYQMQQGSLSTSKWFTIDVWSASWYHVIPTIPTGFGEWLAANYKDEMDNKVRSDVPRSYLADFLNSLKNNSTWFCCSRLRDAQAIISKELDPRMDALYERYLANAQSCSLSGTCFATKSGTDSSSGTCFATKSGTDSSSGTCFFATKGDTVSQEKEQEQQAKPPTSKWFIVEYDTDTDLYEVTPNLCSPFDQWVDINCWNLYKDNDLTYAIKYGIKWCLNTTKLQEFLTIADQRVDEMYTHYKNEQPPTSKWFTIEYNADDRSLYEVSPDLEQAFEQWIAANSGDFLIETKYFTYFIKNTQYWLLDRNQLQDLLAAANPLLDEIYECFLAKKEPLPKSKWFTIDYDPDCTHLYMVSPILENNSFAEWLVANCWDLYIRGKAPARAIKNKLMWILSDRQLREFLTEADYRMDELYEQHKKEQEAKRAEEEARRAEEDSSNDSSDSDDSSDYSSDSDDTSDDSSNDSSDSDYSDSDESSDEEDCEPWIYITTAKMMRFRVIAPREFVKFCTGKTFAGVQIDWKANAKSHIQIKPIRVWRSNLANLGCGRIIGKGMLCEPKTFPRLQAALAEAHSTWQPDKSSDRMVIGKPTVEFDICREELGYRVRYHPSLGRNTRLGGVDLVKTVVAEAMEMDDTRPKLIIE